MTFWELMDGVSYLGAVLIVFLVPLWGLVLFLRVKPVDDVYRCSNCSVPHFDGTCTSSNCVDYPKYNNPKYIRNVKSKEDEIT